MKRGQFIGKIHSLLNEFYFATPDVKTRLFDIYATCFYSSSLWNLFSPSTERLYKSFNVAIRIAWDVPRTTHCHFIEPLCSSFHPKTMLCSRYVKFHKTLTNCKKSAVRVLAKLCEANAQTVLGANFLNIAQESECNIDELTPNLVKNAVFYRKIPEDEQWKVPFLMELLSIRSDDILVDNFTNIEFDEIINILCTS